MGAKKKKGGKGKGKAKKGGEFGLDVDEENHVLEAMKESLVGKLIRETEYADKQKAAEGEKRVREQWLDKKVKEEERIQMEIISDMTRQYKSVEEEMNE